MATVEWITNLPDAEHRAVEAQGFVDRAEPALAAVRQVRNEAVRRLHAEGWTQVRIGKRLGLTQVTVSKILRGAR